MFLVGFTSVLYLVHLIFRAAHGAAPSPHQPSQNLHNALRNQCELLSQQNEDLKREINAVKRRTDKALMDYQRQSQDSQIMVTQWRQEVEMRRRENSSLVREANFHRDRSIAATRLLQKSREQSSSIQNKAQRRRGEGMISRSTQTNDVCEDLRIASGHVAPANQSQPQTERNAASQASSDQVHQKPQENSVDSHDTVVLRRRCEKLQETVDLYYSEGTKLLNRVNQQDILLQQKDEQIVTLRAAEDSASQNARNELDQRVALSDRREAWLRDVEKILLSREAALNQRQSELESIENILRSREAAVFNAAHASGHVCHQDHTACEEENQRLKAEVGRLENDIGSHVEKNTTLTKDSQALEATQVAAKEEVKRLKSDLDVALADKQENISLKAQVASLVAQLNERNARLGELSTQAASQDAARHEGPRASEHEQSLPSETSSKWKASDKRRGAQSAKTPRASEDTSKRVMKPTGVRKSSSWRKSDRASQAKLVEQIAKVMPEDEELFERLKPQLELGIDALLSKTTLTDNA